MPNFWIFNVGPYWVAQGKGEIKPKADWCAIDSPKKQTNKFFFAITVRNYLKLEISSSSFKYFRTVKQKNKTNSFVLFLEESTACQSAYGKHFSKGEKNQLLLPTSWGDFFFMFLWIDFFEHCIVASLLKT